MGILASAMFYMYDVDKSYNIIINITWFHCLTTPVFIFSWKSHCTMVDMIQNHQTKLATMNWCQVFGGSFVSHTSPDIFFKHNIKKTASKRNIWGPFYILPRISVRVAVKEEEIYVFMREKTVYLNPNPNTFYRNVKWWWS